MKLVCKVGLGLTYLSHTDDILAGLMARKQLFVGPATNPITVKVKAQADFNTHTAQACWLVVSLQCAPKVANICKDVLISAT